MRRRDRIALARAKQREAEAEAQRRAQVADNRRRYEDAVTQLRIEARQVAAALAARGHPDIRVVSFTRRRPLRGRRRTTMGGWKLAELERSGPKEGWTTSVHLLSDGSILVGELRLSGREYALARGALDPHAEDVLARLRGLGARLAR